ncbi:efflux RND transporter periplasmic adaptor subunit [Pseudoalteromonas ruthenica]|uniref:efflux RND transporter periplasmic adaptor subunit n=1 Tax=Pseudoalteromonas ruthenica TaxID=151081 RepID=UPI00110A25FF|nr:efflux RND transporter periplasmic adaptor subunit [Pseudoalteromonas ruthenica]TMO42448.1 efflux transporter periplasmic adaptor subunit [Pseudoalteromonas ruthenica]TMO48449.1 efflux transporter periplasmic adaptor subunit [Pseudoalteromonas ruthenica]
MRLIQKSAVLLSTVLILVGCSEEASQQSCSRGPAMTIDVASVQMQPAQRWHSFTTRLEAPSKVALKSRVSGQITQTLFTEGEQVQKGQPLFQIDPRPFAAQVERLSAQLISNSAALALALALAQREAERAQRLLAKNAMSTEQAGQRDAVLKQREAERKLQAAELDLEFATIRSPINGVKSRAEITVGNHVTAGQDILTRIVSNDRVYAYFNADERTWYQDFATTQAQSNQAVILKNLRQGNGEDAITGHIDFIDNEINARTGTLRVRDGGETPISPGHTDESTLSVEDFADSKLTLATMLVNTNDAFTGVNAVDLTPLAAGQSISLYGHGYDAGTEANSELAQFIPGPAGMGEGFNAIRDEVSKGQSC